ncbi:hypothetical protein HO173_009937 [Letharia columbiana]|uniref:Uncharacterized protein n=1 Tax=Letharia columbiana TaxID=112416 RepID=A0A8H6L1B2_9LECA|nr:uncharacterized protein HO173_009937 [Letharia columbiana]KAF6231854.1 hypothetical protein HO173_009937 [Letharia columbiana]
MPPKIIPRPRQSARKNRDTTQEYESLDVVSTPSSKEALANDDNEVQDISGSGNAEQTDVPETQPEIFTSRDVSASTPTVVAGSPPPRRSVQRLKSALPRNSPNPASNSSVADGLDNRPTGLKFKPKSFIRRSKEEREAEEKAEAVRRAARQAVEGTSSTSDRGGNYGRGRGRGQRGGFGDMSKWKNERFNLSHEASGHLGGSTIQEAAMSRNRRGGGFRAGNAGPSEAVSTSGTSRVKKEPAVKPEKDRDGDVIMSSSTSKPKRTKVKKEDQGPTYVSSEGELDSDGGERVNIEDINIINLVSSEDEDEEPVQPSRISKGKRHEATPRVPGSNLMPVRIQRQEHVERAVGVNTDASSLTSAELRRRAKIRAEAGGSLFLPEGDEADVLSATKPKTERKPKDVEFVRNERKWKGVYQDEDDREGIVKIKTEPKDDRDVMLTDRSMGDGETEPVPLDDIDLANTSTRPTVSDSDGTLKSQASLEGPGAAPEGDPLPHSGERLRRIKGYHGLRPVEVSEEEEEDEIFAEIADIVLTKNDVPMDTSRPELASSTKIPDDDGDLDLDNEGAYFQRGGKEEVYLFQLPPVVPSLRDISKATSKSEDKKKNKAVSAEAPRSSASRTPLSTQIKDEPNIKPDPDELHHETAVPHAYTSDSFHPTGGWGGALSIHAKGSMLATWGGMSFEISKEGTGAKLAQELIMTEFESALTKVEDESRWEEKVDVGKMGYAMGQTHPGHVCIPELSDLLS